MHDDAIQQLRLFIEKVEKLLSLSLVCSLIERGSGLRISWTKDAGAPEVSLTGPASEQVDALVLTMRLFMQDNDRISVGRVANLLETLPVSEKLKEYFEKNRSHLNHALDSPSMLVVNNDHPSKRDILQTALYGATCHVEERHRARYQSWVGAPMAQQNIDFEFDGILVVFLRALTAMAEISRRTVWELEGDAPEDYPQSPDPAQKTTYSNKRST